MAQNLGVKVVGFHRTPNGSAADHPSGQRLDAALSSSGGGREAGISCLQDAGWSGFVFRRVQVSFHRSGVAFLENIFAPIFEHP
jgi:hypothetical protein